MPTRLAERLLQASHRAFVGREEECALFDGALGAEALPFCVLHLVGPGGVGKTTLLHEFQYRCSQREVPAYYLDSRTMEPNPESFIEGLRDVLDLPAEAEPVEHLATGRHVLLLDTYELLVPLERWLLQRFLPRLTDEVLVVCAGRQPPSALWTTDPGWQALTHIHPLRNFSQTETRAYLSGVGLPEDQHETVLGFTHGFPLALSLVAENFAQRPEASFRAERDPDIVKRLLDRFVMKVPGPAHRAALEACALVHFTTEPLLALMLDLPDAHELFEWVRDLSFIDAGPFGLFPHDLARDALSADVRWRNPDWFAELHDRARSYYKQRLDQTSGRAQQRVLSDYMYLHRDNPVIKPFLDWEGTGSAVPEPPTESDGPALERLVAQHEGDASARLLAHWLRRQPQHMLVFRDPDGQPSGLLTRVALEDTTAEDREADPAVVAALAYLDAHAPLRAGERASHFRFWMDAEAYQGVSSTQSLIFLKIAQHYLTASDLAYSFFPCADPDFWAPFCAYGELERLPEADYEVGGKHYGVYGHDWRAVPPALWLDHLAAHELSTSETLPEPPPAETPLLVLSKDAFAEAVRDALRAYARPDHLLGNPLLRSRIVIDELAEATNEAATDEAPTDEAARVEALLRLLHETAETLQGTPKQQRHYRALDRTYFRPAPSQEQAAELLDLPFSTFRRHLKAGIDALTALLWRREVGG